MISRLFPLLLFRREALAFFYPLWPSPTRSGSRTFGTTSIAYRRSTVAETELSSAHGRVVGAESVFFSSAPIPAVSSRAVSVSDPAQVEFVPSERVHPEANSHAFVPAHTFYPYAAMMQGSAHFIAAHAGEIAVVYIPGDILERPGADNLISDLAVSWLLGMKIVLVIGSRFGIDQCDLDTRCPPHEAHNTLKVTDIHSIRHLEEEAGYLRTEVERKLNRRLRMHGCAAPTGGNAPFVEANVVSGHFYTAERFGEVRGQDFQYTGFTSGVHVRKIHQVLGNNDVVLLNTVGLSPVGDVVNVNGYHLAASVAAAMDAYKLVYMANEGSVMTHRGDGGSRIQELPLSFAQDVTRYHGVDVHNTGFATFERARKSLEPRAVEMLLHLGWSSWALDRGVRRAHIINPGDGAILEELFTSKNGANTCLFHDEEQQELQDQIALKDWDEFFAAADAQAEHTTSLR